MRNSNRMEQRTLKHTYTQTLESMPRELAICPEDMLKPTSNAALRSLSACSCSCNLETYNITHRLETNRDKE